MSRIRIGPIEIGGGAPLALIAGPCVIESEAHAIHMAESVMTITRKLGIPMIFKASYDKANRTSLKSFRGIGIRHGLDVLAKVRKLGLPVLTDVHETTQVAQVAEVVDCIQVPAFLVRQTDLLLAVGRTGRPINLKKSQLMAPFDVRHAVEKVSSTGNGSIMVTERGTSFGYNNLVVDFRGLQVMRNIGCPVIFDASHSVQLPGGGNISTSGEAEFIPALSRAAAAVGVDGLFVEVHDAPDRALSDARSALNLGSLELVLRQVVEIDAALRRCT